MNPRKLKFYFLWTTWRAKGFWLAAVPTLLGGYWGWRLPLHETQFTLCLGVLQVLGVGLTMIGLYGDASQHGRTLYDPFVSWWDARPWKVISGQVVSSTAGLEANVALSADLDALHDGTVEVRLKVLEGYVHSIRKRILPRLSRELEEAKEEARDQIEAERKERREAIDKLNELLRDHAAGSIGWGILGIYWVLLGTVLGTFAGLKAL